MRRGFFLLMILLALSCKRKVNPEYGERNDSVEKYLALASNDSLPFAQRKDYNEKALSFVDLKRNDTVTRWYLGEISNYFLYTFNLDGYLKSSNKHFTYSKIKNDTLNLARYYRYQSVYYVYHKKNIDSAFYYILKAEKFYLKTNDINGLVRIYLQKSSIQSEINDYLGAELTLKKAIIEGKKIKPSDKHYEIYNNLANLYDDLGNYQQALKFHFKSLELVKKLNLKYTRYYDSFEGTSLNNIGNTYRLQSKYDKALLYLNKALYNKSNLKNDYLLKAYVLCNKSYCQLMIGDLRDVESNLKLAIYRFDKRKIKNEAAISRIYLSKYYLKVKDSSKAIYYAEEALKFAKESKSSHYYLIALNHAGVVNFKKAPTYIAEYHRLNDSLLFQERKARNQFYKIQLETDEIAKEKETAIRQKWVQTAIIASVLLIVILLFIIYRQRSHQKELKLVQSQQEANAEIYRLMLYQQTQTEEVRQQEKHRIALELHDNVMNKLASSRFNLFPLTQNPDQHIQQHASQQAQTLKEIEDEIRNLTHELAQPQAAERNSFEDLLQAFTEEQNRKGDLHFTLHLEPSINWDTVASEAKMHLYRIIQEGVHNIRKHAEATQVTIHTLQTENTLGLELQDNGKGFDTTTTHKGIGLQNMQNRMKSVGGTVSIHSHPGKTTIQACIPAQHNK